MRQRALFTCCLLFLCDCTPGTMPLPDGVAAISDELPISEYTHSYGALVDESFRMGPYAVNHIDRNYNGHGIGPFHIESRIEGFAFDMSGAHVTIQAECVTETRKPRAKDGFFAWPFGRLGCTCHDSQGETDLLLEGSSDGHYSGTVQTPYAGYRVRSIHERNDAPTTRVPGGYRIDAGNAALGAVDILGDGHVFLAHSFGDHERADLACTAAALMLYHPPR